MIKDYYSSLLGIIARARSVRLYELQLDEREPDAGFIRGDIYFADGSRLHVREFVNTEFGIERVSYAYHYQSEDGALVFRYDDTAHFPDLSTFPHHKHVNREENVIAAAPPDLASVIAEIEARIPIP
ncbi:MAG: hypothetical protein EYC68_22645 [Chloroflexota bacterium]|nr:MAG: hypothetical protein EYC68_22645 [Chloroflexota bacterium]